MQAEVTFCDAKERSCSCSNSNSLATLASCLYAVGHTSKKSWSPLVDYCSRYQVTLDDNWFDTALANYKKNAKSASEIENFNVSEPIDVPFILNTTNMKIYQESYGKFYDNLYDSIYYGAGFLGYWLLVLLLGAILNWTKFLFPGFTKKMTNPAINFWRTNVSIPATFGKKKSQEQQFLKVFSFLIPSRFESLVIFLFYCVVIWLNSMSLRAIKEDVYFGSKYQ
ncbi:hypothetical protein CORT_0A09380, partial [Candida orthopsilosis Co 90-125]